MKTAAAIAEVKEIRFTILASSSLLSIYTPFFSQESFKLNSLIACSTE